MIKSSIGTCVLAAMALGGLAGCVSLRVTSDVNRAVAGSVQCHTFAWAGAFKGNSSLRTSVANPVNESRLRYAITANLATVGVQPAADGAAADCLVGYGIGAHTAVDPGYPVGMGWGWGYGWGWGWGPGFYGGYGWDGPYVYHEGVIAVDLYDAKSKQPIWHASVNQSLYGLTGADAEEKIARAVAAIFTKYPH